ncbi:MAG TPA: response regulator transcription factor [Streptosporangiaceae bacterium]|jgi:DNA-binding NarL/FixJ family response regulator|nr:response regulator transcription factor [Streptosporangiaceae bacterium]
MIEAGSPEQVITVFLLDDHELVRTGVRDFLETQPDIRVVGEAGTASAALDRIPVLRPDVAILDLRLPDGDGVSVCRQIRSRWPEIACLMLSTTETDRALSDAMLAGAAGWVLKQIRGTDLIGSVRAAAGRPDPLAGLTGPERDLLELIGQGLTNRQIAQQLHLAEKTVKNYASVLFTKLGVRRRAQAAARIAG